MSDYIPDPIERGEASAERWHYDYAGPDGKMRCYVCDAVFMEGEGGTLSADPYAPEACPTCLSERMKEWEEARRQRELPL